MHNSPAELQALQRSAQELETPLMALEERLSAMATALKERDADRIEAEAAALQRALAGAVAPFSRAARHGALPPALRARLMAAGAQVAAQREVLARATASLDRAIDVLLPPGAPGVYSAAGSGDRAATGGSTQA